VNFVYLIILFFERNINITFFVFFPPFLFVVVVVLVLDVLVLDVLVLVVVIVVAVSFFFGGF